MTTVAIHQPQYFPYLGFFQKLRSCDVFVVLDHVQYSVGGLINRNKIKSPTGWQWLTVPTNGSSDTAIAEVLIDAKSNWRRKHWNSLQTNYGRAPFFKEYADELRALLLDGDQQSLSVVNIVFIEWMMKKMDITTPLIRSSNLAVEGSSSKMLLSICQTLKADRYLSGRGGRRYLDLAVFQAAGIEVTWQSFTPPRYRQVYPSTEFVENLSVLDALLSTGPECAAFTLPQAAQ